MKETVASTLLLSLLACSSAWAEQSAEDILRVSGIQGGLIVELGCGEGELTTALGANDSLLVQGLDTDSANIAKARARIRSLGLGGRVSVDTYDGRRLPYVDNLVNLVVAEDLGAVSMDEVMRVLAPLGVAYVDGEKIVKPWPDEIDEWTQEFHGVDVTPSTQRVGVFPERGGTGNYLTPIDPVFPA